MVPHLFHWYKNLETVRKHYYAVSVNLVDSAAVSLRLHNNERHLVQKTFLFIIDSFRRTSADNTKLGYTEFCVLPLRANSKRTKEKAL